MATEHVAGYIGKATSIGREFIVRGPSPKPIVLLTGSGANDTWQGDDDNELIEVIILADKSNAGDIQVSLFAAVSSDNYIPLAAKDSIKLEGIKYSDIHIKIVSDGDKVTILRSEADGDLTNAETV